MSYLDHIKACNQWNPDNFVPFLVDGQCMGWIKHEFVQLLYQWPDCFVCSGGQVELHPGLQGFENRNLALENVLEQLVVAGAIPHIYGEKYPVMAEFGQPAACLIDRAAAPFFGIRAYGQHINGYVCSEDTIELWIGLRASDRNVFPNRLDNMVAGGLPYGIGLKENLAKECGEEAGIPAELAARARPVGAISYCCETERGLKPDTLFCYDLQLPSDFVPRCTDGEVAGFYRWPASKVAEIVRETGRFKPNCNLVIIDFLIRHGLFKPEDAGYLTILARLKSDI